MKKLSVAVGILLIAIGLGGIASYGWNKDEDKLATIEKTWTFEPQDLRQLIVSSDYDVAIEFVKSTDGKNRIALEGKGTEKIVEQTTNAKIADQTLELDLRRKNGFFDFGFFRFGFNKVQEKLTIAVADQTEWDLLKLNLDSGNVTLNDASLLTLRETRISIDSGNLSIEGFKGEKLDIDIDSGNVTANGIEAQVKVNADSGNIRLTDVRGAADLSVDSGNIRLYKLDTADTTISADSGNVYVQMPASFAGLYDLRADSGRIKAPESKRESVETVKIRTDSGNITVEEQ